MKPKAHRENKTMKIGLVILFIFSLSVVTTQPLEAAGYSLKEVTPAVQNALDARKKRFDRLADLKVKGMIGENNNGYVSALEKNNAAEQLADEENQNRRVIYKAIAQQNGLGKSVDIIEKVFAQVRRDKAQSGEMIQLETGDWVQKQ